MGATAVRENPPYLCRMGVARASAKHEIGEFLRPAAHELGNLLAGIRLTAHFMAGEASAVERTQWGSDVELLITQAGAWVGMLGPLSEGAVETTRVSPDELIRAVHRSVFDLLGGATKLRIPKGTSAPDVQVESQAVHQLLVLLTSGALGEEAKGGVKIDVREEARHVVIGVADTGSTVLAESEPISLRGRELVYHLGDAILRRTGGRLAAVRQARGNRFELWLKKAPKRTAPKAKSTRKRAKAR